MDHDGMGWKIRGEKIEGEGDFNRVGGRTLHFSTLSPRPIYKARNMCMFLPEGKVKGIEEEKLTGSDDQESRPRCLLNSTLHMFLSL